MNIICFVKSIYRSIPNLFSGLSPFSGHDYIDIEEHENVKVTISECQCCGKIDISWEE